MGAPPPGKSTSTTTVLIRGRKTKEDRQRADAFWAKVTEILQYYVDNYQLDISWDDFDQKFFVTNNNDKADEPANKAFRAVFRRMRKSLETEIDSSGLDVYLPLIATTGLRGAAKKKKKKKKK